MLFRRLLRTSRSEPFTAAHVRALGAVLRVRDRHADELLRQLEEDGLVIAVLGQPDHYVFVPYARRQAVE